MKVLHILGGDYHIKLHIRNRADNFMWSLVSVYGAAQDEFKPAFTRELVNLLKDNHTQLLLEGISICYDSLMRRVEAVSTIIGLSCSIFSLIV
jgi:hypothetical protein